MTKDEIAFVRDLLQCLEQVEAKDARACIYDAKRQCPTNGVESAHHGVWMPERYKKKFKALEKEYIRKVSNVYIFALNDAGVNYNYNVKGDL